jgi:hypothetical protein
MRFDSNYLIFYISSLPVNTPTKTLELASDLKQSTYKLYVTSNHLWIMLMILLKRREERLRDEDVKWGKGMYPK